MKTWNDETTGRQVQQLTTFPFGAAMPYFRIPHNIPGGWLLLVRKPEPGKKQKKFLGEIICMHVESGEIRNTSVEMRDYLFLREHDGRLFYRNGRQIWIIDLPEGRPEQIGLIPEEVPGKPSTITCNGNVVINGYFEDPHANAMVAELSKDPETYWALMNRARNSTLYAYDLTNKTTRVLWSSDSRAAHHIDPSPVAPNLLKFAPDGPPMYEQRIIAVHTDKGHPWNIYGQQQGEITMHEFWWTDGLHIGYKYQDRRDDPTIRTIPYSEYASIPTKFCLADLDGNEVYRSDPINFWHTHICVSSDGKLLGGEGTHDHMHVYAALFDQRYTTIDFIPLATLHSKYQPFVAAHVNCGFLSDSKTLVYGDTIDGVPQVCAVKTTF